MLDELIMLAIGGAMYQVGKNSGQKQVLDDFKNHQRDMEIELLKRQIEELKKLKYDVK